MMSIGSFKMEKTNKRIPKFTEFLNEALPEYKEWADLKNPIDLNKKPLKTGDFVKMDDLSPWKGKLKVNKWEIKSFNKGTSAGIEALIVNTEDGQKRSEATCYLLKLKNKLNEEYGSGIRGLHVATTQKEIDDIRKRLKKDTGWSTSDVEYMLKKYRKSIKYDGPEIYVAPPKAKRTAWNKGMKSTWNARKYKQWIKGMAAEDGADNAYDMAQNAIYEPGLIQYVQKQLHKDWREETPLERIQWDIEMEG